MCETVLHVTDRTAGPRLLRLTWMHQIRVCMWKVV